MEEVHLIPKRWQYHFFPDIIITDDIITCYIIHNTVALVNVSNPTEDGSV